MDNCGVLPPDSIQRTEGKDSGATFPEGPTTVTYKVTDTAGNTAECSFIVTVNCTLDDLTDVLPIAKCKNVTRQADANCEAVSTTVNASEIGEASSDPRGEQLSYSLDHSGPYTLGNNLVVLTVTAGTVVKRNSKCTANVQVVDKVQPTIKCPDPITTNVNGSVCSVLVDYEPIVVKDNCPGLLANSTQLTAGKGDGGFFEVGRTFEKYKVTDAAGNTAECSFLVTVNHLPNVNSQCLELYSECYSNAECGGATSKYFCDKNGLCALSDCDSKIDACCQDSDCNDPYKRCISNLCVNKGKPSFSLHWFGDGKNDRALLLPQFFCFLLTFLCLFGR
jgi:hypothetical protein